MQDQWPEKCTTDFVGSPDVSGKTLQGWVWDAIEGYTSTEPAHRRKCLRQLFAGDYEIDYPVYYKIDGQEYKLAVKDGDYEDSHPKAMLRKTGFFRHERAHGMHGQIESLQQLLSTYDLGNMSWLLGQAIDGYKMDRTSLCFCGSKRKYRHCHRDILERFKKMEPGKLSLLKKMIDDYIIAA